MTGVSSNTSHTQPSSSPPARGSERSSGVLKSVAQPAVLATRTENLALALGSSKQGKSWRAPAAKNRVNQHCLDPPSQGCFHIPYLASSSVHYIVLMDQADPQSMDGMEYADMPYIVICICNMHINHPYLPCQHIVVDPGVVLHHQADPVPGLQARPRGGEDDAVLLEVVRHAAELQPLPRAVLLPRDDTRQVPDVDGEDVERNVEYRAVCNLQLNLQPRSEEKLEIYLPVSTSAAPVKLMVWLLVARSGTMLTL